LVTFFNTSFNNRLDLDHSFALVLLNFVEPFTNIVQIEAILVTFISASLAITRPFPEIVSTHCMIWKPGILKVAFDVVDWTCISGIIQLLLCHNHKLCKGIFDVGVYEILQLFSIDNVVISFYERV